MLGLVGWGGQVPKCPLARQSIEGFRPLGLCAIMELP